MLQKVLNRVEKLLEILTRPGYIRVIIFNCKITKEDRRNYFVCKKATEDPESCSKAFDDLDTFREASDDLELLQNFLIGTEMLKKVLNRVGKLQEILTRPGYVPGVISNCKTTKGR